MSHASKMNDVAHMIESWRTYEWVMSQVVALSHEPHILSHEPHVRFHEPHMNGSCFRWLYVR